VMSFRPGAAFILDYERFYLGRHQREVQFEFHNDRQEVAEPLKVAYLFIEKRNGRTTTSVPYVSSKEVDTARQLLARISFQDMPNFLEFALAEAKSTRFEVQTLGGLKQYVATYLERHASKQRATAAAHARHVRDKEEADQAAYQQHWRQSALTLFASLPAAEKATVEEMARAQCQPGSTRSGPLSATLFEMAKAQIIAERHAGDLPTMDQWKAARCVLNP